jgi:hypothetical protein
VYKRKRSGADRADELTPQVCLCVPRAERGNADADKKPCVVAVQAALLQYVVRDAALVSPTIEFIADLVSGNDRGLLIRKGNALGLQRIQEVVVDGVGTGDRGGNTPEAEHCDR